MWNAVQSGEVIHICLSILLQSSDRTARVWDARSGQGVMWFDIHESDVNAVRFFPSGEALGTACSDGTVRLHGFYNWGTACIIQGLFLQGCRCLVKLRGGRAVDIDTAR